MASYELCGEWDGPADEILCRIDDAPKCRELFRIWSGVRGDGRTLPARTALDPVLLAEAGLMPYLWVVERDDAGNCFYRLAGEGVRRSFTMSVRGRYLDDVFSGEALERIKARYERILREELLEFSSGSVYRGDTAAYYARRLIVPLSDEAGTPRFLIGIVDQLKYNASAKGAEPLRYTYDFVGLLRADSL